MKTLIFAAIRCSLMFLLPAGAYAISAQWDLDPMSGDWNTAANWTPDEVPNGPADIATFGFSNTNNVSISADTEVNGIVFTAAQTNITASPGFTLTISGTGITNNTGTSDLQNFVTAGVAVGFRGLIEFTNNATAGFNTHFTNNAGEAITGGGGVTFFRDSSTAANGTFINNGATVSGVGALVGGGATAFSENSHAANGSFSNLGGTVAGAGGGLTIFALNSHADSAILTAFGGANGGEGGTIVFQANSDGGTSQVAVFGNGSLDLSNHNSGSFTIGSIEGDGRVLLNDEKNVDLVIGGNNLNTTFSGVISGSNFGEELDKVGTGTLTLSGNTTYNGDIEINRGVLKVDGSFGGGNTFVHANGTLAGGGTVRPSVEVQDGGRVSPGSANAPGTLTVDGSYTQSDLATLIIQIAGTSDGQFSVLEVFGRNNTASLGGTLEPVLLNGFIPEAGDTFAFLFYPDHVGEFSRIANENFFDDMHWVIKYEDRMAFLKVVGPVPGGVPDQGSTFLLLMLGLLGLVTYRRQLLRGQP